MSSSVSEASLQWFVDEFMYFRGRLWISGWAFHPFLEIAEMGLVLPGFPYEPVRGYGNDSLDVESVFGPVARQCRFSATVEFQEPERYSEVKLVFVLQDGTRCVIEDLVAPALRSDPCQAVVTRFFGSLAEKPSGKVLEIGARNRTGVLKRALVPANWEYIGLDMAPSDGVDVVADAHSLRKYFRRNSFDAVFGMAVFEHLIMPWKAAIEINRCLKVGGLVMVVSHQTFPLHDLPWDYFRFSSRAWRALFNRATGFEILQVAESRPASVVAHQLGRHTWFLDKQPAFIHSAVLARKIRNTRLRWDVRLEDLEDAPPPG
jgi:SAM-dependent methyltransferase